MADPAPATTAAPNAAAQVAQVEASTQASTAQALAQDGATLDDAWSKAVAAEEGLSLEDGKSGKARDGKGKFQKAAPAEGAQEGSEAQETPAGGQDAPADESATAKARKFSQAVREKARQGREQLAQRARLEQENDRLSRIAVQHQQERELLARDPIAFYRQQGKTAEEISSILLNSAADGTPEGEIRQLKEQLAELNRRQEEQVRQERARQQKTARDQDWRTFMDNQGSNAEEYPLLASTAEPLVDFAAQKVAQAIVEDGAQRGLSAKDALGAYDNNDFAEGIELWLTRHKRQAKAGQAGDNGQGTVDRVQKRPAPRTATPSLNGRRHAPRPDLNSMTREQQDAAIDDGWAKARHEEDVIKR